MNTSFKYFVIIFLVLKCNSFNYVNVNPFGSNSSENLVEHVIESGGNDKILIIPISGVISDDPPSAGIFGGSSGESILSKVKADLQKAASDSDVKAVLLKIDSPGGTVTASDILYKEILSYKRKTNRPVVSLFMDTAASGAYYIAMTSDIIVAHPTTVTGSIGVIMQGINVKEGLEKIGVKDQTITSGQNKAIGSPLSEMNPEQKKILQSVVDSLYERFFAVVKQNRSKISEDRLRSLCDGRIYTSEQAFQNGLIDKIGYYEDALLSIKSISNYKGTDKPKIVTYSFSKKNIKNLYQVNSELDEIHFKSPILESIFPARSQAKFMYLWTLQ